ncbi:MAG: hypothetical protein JSS82_07820 [Bacteroidetes bacterium]|nr:hypothetical protein [Bacteroidota bacterium]
MKRRNRTPARYLDESHPDRATWNAVLEFVRSKLIRTDENPSKIEHECRGEPEASFVKFTKPKFRHRLKKALREQGHSMKWIRIFAQEVSIIVNDDEYTEDDGDVDEEDVEDIIDDADDIVLHGDSIYVDNPCNASDNSDHPSRGIPDSDVRFTMEFNYVTEGYDSFSDMYIDLKWNDQLLSYELVEFGPLESY